MKNQDPVIRDMKPDLGDFRTEFLKGMLSNPKCVNPKFFYDERGSKLFVEITGLQEYYPTRSELGIIEEHCTDLASISSEIHTVVELGSGNGDKGERIMQCMPGLERYVFMDISLPSIHAAVESSSKKHPDLVLEGICCDFSQTETALRGRIDERKILAFLGSTIGNMEPDEVERFLGMLRRVMSHGDFLILGVDLKKDRKTLEDAYNDSRGVTAKFNGNVMDRAGRDLKIPVSSEDFVHLAFYNESEGRIEMHLVARKDISFEMDGHLIEIRQGEKIHTENSYKYTKEEISRKLTSHSFKEIRVWADDRDLFAIVVASV